MIDLSHLTREQKIELVAALEEEKRRIDAGKLYRLFPDTGPLRRELYPKHMEFFAAGKAHQERAFIAANRVGKTLGCSYETTCHLSGWYPDWWQGYRFKRPVTVWAAGEDTKAVRESLQVTFLGPYDRMGTGLVPGEAIKHTTPRSGVAEAVDTATIAHVSGGMSRLVFKSYDQGRESFQASKVDIVQYDEEPPMAIYTEGLTRTMSTVPGEPSGLVICGFTPLRGLSGVVLSYMPGGQRLEGSLLL